MQPPRAPSRPPRATRSRRPLVAVLALAGCGGASAPAPEAARPRWCEPGQRRPDGAPAMFTRGASVAGLRIDPPEACTGRHGGTYYAVHGAGTRPLRSGSEAAATCPTTTTDPTACVFADALGRAVLARLGDTDAEVGASACAVLHGPAQALRPSIVIHDWAMADAAVDAVAAELTAQNVSGVFGVSIEPRTCPIPL